MGGSSATTVLLGVLGAAIIGALSWFFYFSPNFESMAQTALETESQRALNDAFEIEVRSLAADFERLPEFHEEIRVISQDTPPVEDGPGLGRLFGQLADEQDVLLEKLEMGDAEYLMNTVTLADAAAVFGQGSYVEDLEFEHLVATSFSTLVVGPSSDVLAMLDRVQNGDHRYILVSSVESTGLDPAPAEGTRPEIEEGWVEATITGYSFTFVIPNVDPNLKLGPGGAVPFPESFLDEDGEPEEDQSETPEEEEAAA
jgi:hypothetical protein